MSLQELERSVARLPLDELEAFSKWFEQFLAEAADEGDETASEASPPLSQEWMDEIQRRSREIDEGRVQPVPFILPILRLNRLRSSE